MDVDWDKAKNMAAAMLERCHQEIEAGEEYTTIIAAGALFITSLDKASEDADKTAGVKRPSNLEQFYLWAASCVSSLLKAFPLERERSN